MPPLTGREAKKVLFYSLDCPFCLLPLLYFVWGHSAQIGALMHFLHQRAAHLVFLEWKFTPGGYSTFLISKYQGTGCRKMAHTLTSRILGPFHVGCSCSPHACVAFLWAPSQTRPFPSPKWRCPSADTHIFFILNPRRWWHPFVLDIHQLSAGCTEVAFMFPFILLCYALPPGGAAESRRSPTGKTSNANDEGTEQRRRMWQEVVKRKGVLTARWRVRRSKEENKVGLSDQGGESSGAWARSTQPWDAAGTNCDEDVLPHHRQTAAARLQTGERCLFTCVIWILALHVHCHDYLLMIKFGAVHPFAW